MGFYDEENIPVTLSTLIERYIDDEEIKPEQAILHHEEGIDLIPSNLNLAMTESNLSNAMSREYAMRKSLEELKSIYDYIIIDCMPSLSMLITNALAMADEVIIPVQSQYFSARGTGNLLKIISKVKKQINSKLQVGGILLILVDSRTKLPNKIKQELGNQNSYTYDLKGQITEIINSKNAKKTYTYDANGNTTSITDELGNVKKYNYDLLDRLIEVEDQKQINIIQI